MRLNSELPIKEIAIDNAFVQNLQILAGYKSGFVRGAMLRALIASTEPWWTQVANNEWGLTIKHPTRPEETIEPNYWQLRVLRLCTYDITMNNFGLSYNDLMNLDVETFNIIQEKIEQMDKEQKAALKREGIGTKEQ